jgi:hypothetical protein
MDTLAVRLTLPATKRAADFHRQVTPYAGRTYMITAIGGGFLSFMK